MSDSESELLKICDLVSLSGGDFNLNIQVLKSIIVHEDNEVTMNQVVSPVSNSLHHCIKLHIISVVSATCS